MSIFRTPDTIQVMSPETLNQVSNRENTEPLAANPDTIRPFEINVDEAAIADLHARLALTRLPDQIPGTSWEYGTELSYLDELLGYWQSEFDWPAQQDALISSITIKPSWTISTSTSSIKDLIGPMRSRCYWSMDGRDQSVNFRKSSRH